MIRAVLDTNTLASGSSQSKGIPGKLLTAWRHGRFELVISDHILMELEETLEDRYFKKRLTRREKASLFSRLRRQSLLTPIETSIQGVAPSPKDDLVLATAVSAGADCLVSGDMKLRDVQEHQGVRIVSPREFLEILQK
jgi:putative PIN family toxin of toxin-antitoxin system